MRIGLVCPYSLVVNGGVQSHVSDLAAVMSARGHHVSVLAPGPPPERREAWLETTGTAVPIAFNGSTARIAFGPLVAARVRRWLDRGRFDIVHIHEPLAPSLSLITLWMSEAPLVATFHSAVDRSLAFAMAGTVLGPSMNKIAARIAVSDHARRTLQAYVGGGATVIPNGITCAMFGPASAGGARSTSAPDGRGDAQEVFGSPRRGEPPVVAFLGRVRDRRKGIAVMLAAWPRIRRTHPDTVLAVAGHGSAEIRSMSGGAAPGIRGFGQLDDVERSAFLAGADVFVAPQTHGESFGIVVVEALASGTAVVASDIPAFRSVLAEGGLGDLFPPGDAAALSDRVGALLSDRRRREQLACDGLQAAGRYDWAVVAPTIESIYDSAVRTARPDRRTGVR